MIITHNLTTCDKLLSSTLVNPFFSEREAKLDRSENMDAPDMSRMGMMRSEEGLVFPFCFSASCVSNITALGVISSVPSICSCSKHAKPNQVTL